ncbi:host attachment protein [Acidocella sp.]|uniref:host attachment protein n=1 Tax=Acidocella sp. TaxID=50710 RepID=UPI0026351A54|nr:host attachment protein [Acidocella sp.]
MPTRKKHLVVVADAEHARIVRADEHHVLRTVRRIESAAAHKQSSDLRSDRPGAAFHSDATVHHGLQPRHDPQTLEAERFAKMVTDEVNGLAETCDALIIAAPTHTLTMVKNALTPEALTKLTGVVAKDLVKTPDDELWGHLNELLPAPTPPRRQ